MAFMSWLEHASWLYAGLERGPDTSLQSITLDLRRLHGIGILLTLFGSFCLSASIGGVADREGMEYSYAPHFRYATVISYRCPRCGTGRLFGNLLNVAEPCSECELDLSAGILA